MTDETLVKHFNLLQQEFQKINNKYQLLKAKYDQLSITNGNSTTEDNFLLNLNKIIRGLYKDKRYSDISIKLQRNTIPGHKIVFEANGGEWCNSDLSSCDEIHLENEDQFIGEQIVRWLYLQELNDNQSYEILWKIMKVAHEHGLSYLKSRCEDGLITKVTKDNCIHFYLKSSEFVVENLRNFCSDLIIANWTEYSPMDFNSLEASIFLELLELQSNFPLHQAVKANRDDVVFLYINENFSQLEDVVNVVNDLNEIVLDLALVSKRVELCQTLLSNCANPNSVDRDGWSLLHKAILRSDEFAACFLIQNGCHLNPLSPQLSQTALQLIASLTCNANEDENIEKLNKIAILLIQNGADVNHVDNNDMTALCLTILSGNEVVIKAILESGRCTSINGASSWSANKSKSKNSPVVPRVTSNITVSSLPLWLAVCREYRPEFLRTYKEYREDYVMKTSPTNMLIEHDADPGCLYDAETGNSILLEMISQQMEDAAIFVLDKYSKRQNLKSAHISSLSNMESLVNMVNNFKDSMLHIAVENELITLSGLLLKFGADPNVVRRKNMNLPRVSSKDDMSSSCDSVNSCTSFKEESELNNNHDVIKPNYDISSDSVISSWSSKTDDTNPFKDFMKTEFDDSQPLSISLPTIRKPVPNRCLLVDLALNKKQSKELIKSNHRCKSRKSNNDKPQTMDLCTPVHLAIKTKNLKLINLFIHHDDNDGNQINWLIKDYSGESPFTLTLWNGLICIADKIFRILIKYDFKTTEIDQITVNGQPLLHLAVAKNNIETVQFLIKIGCDINIKSSNGITPLQLATEKLSVEIVKILCLSGADSNIAYIDNTFEKNNLPSFPLWVALANNRWDIAEILTESGADVDMWFIDPRDNYEQTLLHRAILENKENAANFLISHNCDTRSPREKKNVGNEIRMQESYIDSYIEGNTPLHMACQMGLETVVRTLLSNRVIDVNFQNLYGYTPLHLAIRYEQEAVLKLLVDPEFKVNLSIRDKEGRTPFHTAMEMSNQKAAKTILQYRPHAADEFDNVGRNFLHIAIEAINKVAVFFLIQVNANLNVRVKDSFQHTPLHLAVIHGVPEDMIRSLILAGARIEDETIEKQNLLHLAVIYERTYLINFLLENKASTSHQDHNFDTPLHLAIKGGNKNIVEPLLNKSASSIRMKNLKGENILHVLSNNAKENAVVLFTLIMDSYSDFPIDEKDACGNTALFLSACNDNVRLGIAMLMKSASLGCVNNDGSRLFNCELISDQTVMKLLDSLQTEPSWQDGDLCVSCLCKFTIKNRKHHCRHCGRLVCGKCSVNEMPIIKFSIKKSVRVCDVCFNFIVNGKLQ